MAWTEGGGFARAAALFHKGKTMKQLNALLIGAFMLVCASAAWALQNTPTPPVPPNETGEASQHQQEILDVARLKPGQCTVTTTGSSNANVGTCNGASGVITTNSISIAVTTGSAVVTIQNNKVQAGDIVLCTLDATGATATSLPDCSSVQVSAGQMIFTLTNTGAATEVANLKIYFLVLTKGNPN